MKQIVDIEGAAEAIQKSLPPTIALTKTEIQSLVAAHLAKKLAAQGNVYYAIKRADKTYFGVGAKARIFNSRGAATSCKRRRKYLADATVVPVAMGEIKFEIEA